MKRKWLELIWKKLCAPPPSQINRAFYAALSKSGVWENLFSTAWCLDSEPAFDKSDSAKMLRIRGEEAKVWKRKCRDCVFSLLSMVDRVFKVSIRLDFKLIGKSE